MTMTASDAAKPEFATTGPFPLPAVNRDFAFLYEGYNAAKLLVQKCANGHLRHPPAIACPVCHSLDWAAVEAGVSGRLHSYAVHHHPPIAPWPVPHAIGLADMADGFRFVAAMPYADTDRLRIGAPVRVEFFEAGDAYLLPILVMDTGA